MQIEQIPLKELTPYTRNSRTHSEEQITQVVASIVEYGWTNPVLIDDSGMIIAGHGRTMAAARLKMTEVPCIRLSNLSENQKRAYIIADNQIALNAGWDEALLHEELEALKIEEYDLQLLGFSDAELDDLLTDTEEEVVELPIPEPPVNPTTKLGEIYQLGNHRLMCGDSTSIEAVDRLMDGQKADLMHTDPPYNVAYSNANRPKASKTDLGVIKNDSMSDSDFYNFLFGFYSCAYTFLKDDSTIYVWHTSSEHINFTKALVDSGFKYTQQVIWKKPMLLGRGRYQWAHEPCLMGVKGSPFFTDDRTKTTVWDFGGYDKSKNIHPTQKPIFIPEEAINNSSKTGSNVLDLFGGSGSTLIACEKTSRNAYLMELDPKYCDVIIERWENFTNKKAVKVQ